MLDAFLRRTLLGLACAGLFMNMVPAGSVHAANKKAQDAVPENPFPNRVPAVELDGGIEWLNTSGPISLKDLRGKVVLLDFWTYCCINCMHVLPDLAYLENKYPNELVVIGVHSAKFDNEKESGNIRKAILRYEIAHPVINDAEMVVWRKFAVRSWPTLVLIDPEGNYCGFVSGEGNRELIDKVVEKLIAYHRAKKTLDETPIRFDLERTRQPETPLRFPGKVLADTPSNRLFISDSNHNRIVVTTLTGELLDIIGTGTIGKADGPYESAQFDHPQGMALVGDQLYVADTENHLLRVVNLTTKQVSTFAGTGTQGNPRTNAGALLKTDLASPWDVLHLDGVLYIAMAGPHQIWAHQLGAPKIYPYAGSGREDISNGSLREAALAQPSGLATDGKFIYVCDSEGSSIRKISTKPDNNLARPTGTVATIAGTSDLAGGRSLFEFGDVDGRGSAARLQHPLGIVFHEGKLLVADTYNHKIKQLNLENLDVSTWLAGSDPQHPLTPPGFSEPAGLAISGNSLYIADTNNHRICVADLTSKSLRVLEITGLTPPAPPTAVAESTTDSPAIKVGTQTIKADKALSFEVELQLPIGYKLNPQTPVVFRATAAGEQMLIPADALGVRDEGEATDNTVRFQLPLSANVGQTTLDLTMIYPYCRDGKGGLCKLGTARWSIPIELSATATETVVKLHTYNNESTEK